jgi:ATP-dependent phosphofructokinase / diphosphate-dependent phosphofructokinase
MRVGLLTGGGDSPGLNAVIRAVTKSLIHRVRAEVIGFEDGFLGLIERRARTLSMRDVSGILTAGGTILGTSNKANPFAFHERGGADVSAEVVRYVEDIGLDAIVAIATEALDRLHSTAQAHHRVMILETMGRYTGWIALYAGVASGADIILLPEFEYDIEEVARVCRRRDHVGAKFTIIVVAEGAKPKGGEMAVQQFVADSPDPLRLGGACNVLAGKLESRVESEIRSTILGHVQRGGTPTAFDRALATAFGAYAAAMVEAKVYGRMVALQRNQLTSVPLKEVAGKTRLVTLDAPLMASAVALGTSFGVAGLTAEIVGSEVTAPFS